MPGLGPFAGVYQRRHVMKMERQGAMINKVSCQLRLFQLFAIA
jgi:hypothetical protein